MASDDCCTNGTAHTGSPTGKETKLEGLDAYEADPPTPSDKAVLLLSDAFGWQLTNNRLLADYYAKEANVKVYMPDFFEGTAVPGEILFNPELGAKYDFSSFVAANNRDKRAQKILEVARALKEKHSVNKLAAIGFCWGGMGTIILTSTDLVEGGAVAHPALLSIPDDIDKISKPVLFLCAETDPIFPHDKRQQAEAILEKKKPGLYSKFKDYPGTVHGFAVRGNPDNKPEADAAHDAKLEAVEFFKKVLN